MFPGELRKYIASFREDRTTFDEIPFRKCIMHDASLKKTLEPLNTYAGRSRFYSRFKGKISNQWNFCNFCKRFFAFRRFISFCVFGKRKECREQFLLDCFPLKSRKSVSPLSSGSFWFSSPYKLPRGVPLLPLRFISIFFRSNSRVNLVAFLGKRATRARRGRRTRRRKLGGWREKGWINRVKRRNGEGRRKVGHFYICTRTSVPSSALCQQLCLPVADIARAHTHCANTHPCQRRRTTIGRL